MEGGNEKKRRKETKREGRTKLIKEQELYRLYEGRRRWVERQT